MLTSAEFTEWCVFLAEEQRGEWRSDADDERQAATAIEALLHGKHGSIRDSGKR